MMDQKVVESLVLDATPLITQSASSLQQYAKNFYTTPGVRAELKDEHARNQLLLWGDFLKVRQPKQESIDRVNAFSKLTGDYSVLSMNDVHIIALAYELEVEQNGESNLRKFPGQQLEGENPGPELNSVPSRVQHQTEQPVTTSSNVSPQEVVKEEKDEQDGTNKEMEANNNDEEDDGFQTVAHKKRYSRKHYRQEWQKRKEAQLEEASRESSLVSTTEKSTEATENTANAIDTLGQDLQNSAILEPSTDTAVPSNDDEDVTADSENAEDELESQNDEDNENVYEEEDDDGEWITPDNLQELIMRDDNETVKETNHQEPLLVALSTGDFACQNTSMQLGLKLLNPQSGKQITRVRNYMYRCHACFKMLPMPKTGERKHFCPKCGGDTLLRCAVSVDTATGKVTPHLKANFQWIRKGQVYSMASPLSKNSQKKQGNAGYRHNKENRHKSLQDPVVLREDQKEYAQAIKDDAWHRKKNEKMLAEWIGGGSADNVISPFQTSYRSAGVRVGRGRNANANKKWK